MTPARDKFVVTHGGRFTFGPWYPGGVHAPTATPDGKGGVIALFNINVGKPTPGWNQIMSLPRRLTLAGKDELVQAPAGDIESLRCDHRHVARAGAAGQPGGGARRRGGQGDRDRRRDRSPGTRRWSS